MGSQIRSLIEYTRLATKGNKAQSDMDSFKLLPDIDKSGKISDFLSAGDYLPVQIAKEPINTKGPRISAEISFAGRYLVLVPFPIASPCLRKYGAVKREADSNA